MTLVLFQLSAISREANSCVLEVSSALGTLRSVLKKIQNLKYWHEDLEMQGTMHIISIHLLSRYSCYRNRSSSVPHLLFGFDAELPETSDSECKLQIIRSFSEALKCHSEHCILGGGCKLQVCLKDVIGADLLHLTPGGKTIGLNVVANHDFFEQKYSSRNFELRNRKDHLLWTYVPGAKIKFLW